MCNNTPRWKLKREKSDGNKKIEGEYESLKESAEENKADLRGANLCDLGQDQRGYRFLLFFNKQTKALTISAGCRSFTLAGAWKHWRERHEDPLRAETHARLEMAEKIAQAEGWIEKEKEK